MTYSFNRRFPISFHYLDLSESRLEKWLFPRRRFVYLVDACFKYNRRTLAACEALSSFCESSKAKRLPVSDGKNQIQFYTYRLCTGGEESSDVG